MLRSEAYRLIKEKVRRFCDASIEPSDGAARKLVFELNDIVDHVNTDSGPTLAGMRAKALEALFETGILVRKCNGCKNPIGDCTCGRKRSTSVELNHAVLRKLGAL